MPRSVWLKHEGAREERSNPGTVCLRVGSPSPQACAPEPRVAFCPDAFQHLFRRNYLAIRGVLNRHLDPGLGVFVASSEGLEAWAWAAAKADDISTLIVGRHTEADVYLPSDPELSLRHLAVIVYRQHDDTPVRFRVLDLRTPTAFADDVGTRLEAVEAQGPLMLQCACFAMFLIPTGRSSTEWPEAPDAAWQRIPERVFLERKSADPDRWWAPGASPEDLKPPARESRGTVAITFPGPVFSPRVLDESDPARGEILVRSRSARISLPLGVDAARQGVLLGRYERCDPAGTPILADEVVSRVHLLIVELEDTLYALDTASRNGSWSGEHRMRVVRVEPGVRLMLANAATVEWRPC